MVKAQLKNGRTGWRALVAVCLLALTLLANARPAQAQVYMRTEVPSQPGLYFLGYLDASGELHSSTNSVTPGVAIEGEVYVSIGSSAGDYVLMNQYGFGWWTDNLTQDWECFLFGCFDYFDYIRDTQQAS
jgi:hypothetical protein